METIFKTQTVLITGASSGIGKELTLIFAKNGFNIVLVSRNKTDLETLANDITRDFSIKAFVIAKDLALPSTYSEIVAALEEKNIHVDILVNNAGIGKCENFYKSASHINSAMIEVNINALTTLTRLFLPGMVEKRHGIVVNIASVLGFMPMPYMAVYAATKAYIISFSKSISEELRNTGVSVITICPGPTKTQFYSRSNIIANKKLQKFPQMTAKEVANIAFKNIVNNKSNVMVTGTKNKIIAVVLPFILKIFGLRLMRYVMDGINKK